MDFLVLFGGEAILPWNPGKAGFQALVHEAEKADGWHRIRGEDFRGVCRGWGKARARPMCDPRLGLVSTGSMEVMWGRPDLAEGFIGRAWTEAARWWYREGGVVDWLGEAPFVWWWGVGHRGWAAGAEEEACRWSLGFFGRARIYICNAPWIQVDSEVWCPLMP